MQVIEQIATKISEYGGRTFYVGGYVRDKMLQVPHEDIDIEVFHLTLDELTSILEQFGPLDLIGKTFGVIKIENYPQLDFSLPRKETRTGAAHTDFAISIEQDLSYIDAAKRRDFTCNALMQDVLTGEVLDFFAGVVDINHRILRHIDDDTFTEDTLRGLRGAELAARFQLNIELETRELIRTLYYDNLSEERIQAELQKGLFSFHARSFMTLLYDLNIMQQLLQPLIQLKTRHADKYDNTLELLEQIDELHYERALAEPLKLAALVFYLSEGAARDVIGTFTSSKKMIQSVLALRQTIIDTMYVETATDARRLKNRLRDTTQYWLLLSHLATIDKTIIPAQFQDLEDYQRFFLMSIKNNPGTAPLIQGRDLIALGFNPDKDFADLLQYAKNLEEAGLDKQSIKDELTRSSLKH